MKNKLKVAIGIALVSLSASSFAQSYTKYPDIPGNAQAYAVKVEQYNRGPGVPDHLAVTDNILGAPDDYTGGSALTTGTAGSIVLSFGDRDVRADGTDESEVYVYETDYYEPWDVYASNDMENWTKLEVGLSQINGTNVTGSGSVIGYDLDKSGLDTFKYIKVVDAGTNGGAGPDVDAVVLTHTKFTGGGIVVDTDSRNGTVFNLEKSPNTGSIDVKKISKDGSVDYIPFSTDDSLEPIALSVQGNFDCDDAKDINVLATRKADDVPVNIIKDQQGNDIATIDNSVTK